MIEAQNDNDRPIGEVRIDGAWHVLHDPHALGGYEAAGWLTIRYGTPGPYDDLSDTRRKESRE